MNVNDKVFCILSLGSNMGNREQNLRDAISMLRADERVEELKVASLYETEPVGYEDQPYFLNTCVSLLTEMPAHDLLDLAQSIEQALHRERKIHWGPRTLDIDIILYGGSNINDDRLIVPHPRYRERAFVLRPMMELCEYSGDIPEDKSVKLINWSI